MLSAADNFVIRMPSPLGALEHAAFTRHAPNMEQMISIPRRALAELLQASGSPLSPEEYLASLPDVNAYKKYAGRAKAAAISKYTILLVAVISGIAMCLPIFFGIESLLITIILGTITFFEYRVHRYFREWDPRAPSLGFRNQSAFAAFILLYCIYHAFVVPMDASALVEESTPIDLGSFRALEQCFYLVVGGIAGIFQFGLAWYYRSARVST